MGLREFRDSAGTLWTVWDVTPDGFSERAALQYEASGSHDGWLVFDSADARRRLLGYPPKWASMSEAELARLLDTAQPVKRRISGESAAVPITAQPPASGVPDESRVAEPRPIGGPAAALWANRQARTFTDAAGRAFVAALVRLAPGASDTVLRFVSGRLVLDLTEWPDDWARQSDAQLIDLLRRAQPADPMSIRSAEPLWRESDLPE